MVRAYWRHDCAKPRTLSSVLNLPAASSAQGRQVRGGERGGGYLGWCGTVGREVWDGVEWWGESQRGGGPVTTICDNGSIGLGAAATVHEGEAASCVDTALAATAPLPPLTLSGTDHPREPASSGQWPWPAANPTHMPIATPGPSILATVYSWGPPPPAAVVSGPAVP